MEVDLIRLSWRLHRYWPLQMSIDLTSVDSRLWLPAILLLLPLYLLPAIIAWERMHENRQSILVMTLLLGWTVLGWIGLVIWACSWPQTRLPEAEPKQAGGRGKGGRSEEELPVGRGVVSVGAPLTKIEAPASLVSRRSLGGVDLSKLKSWFALHKPQAKDSKSVHARNKPRQ